MRWERGPYECRPYQANNPGTQYEGRDAWGGEKGLEPVVVVKRILILVTHTTPERHKHKSDKLEFTRKEKSYNTRHNRLLIIGVTRCLRTHTEKAEHGTRLIKWIRAMTGNPRNSVCPCLRLVTQGAAAAHTNSRTRTGKVSRGHSRGLQIRMA